ncbi:hypothetical protein [Maridesulfovibrio sp.]|uniref:hypothetical protein n=1 Tax=Maridesulfovibrio sp. TaxID=2795000 RepID=UPI0029CA1BDD|nr:hypothetical protein [Maridesulfovibrio sp.]
MRTFLLFVMFFAFFSGCTQNEQQAEVKGIKPHTLAEDAAKSGIKWDEESTKAFMNRFVELDSSANSTQPKAKAKN